jgi:hypothetical protein
LLWLPRLLQGKDVNLLELNYPVGGYLVQSEAITFLQGASFEGLVEYLRGDAQLCRAGEEAVPAPAPAAAAAADEDGAGLPPPLPTAAAARAAVCDGDSTQLQGEGVRPEREAAGRASQAVAVGQAVPGGQQMLEQEPPAQPPPPEQEHQQQQPGLPPQQKPALPPQQRQHSGSRKREPDRNAELDAAAATPRSAAKRRKGAAAAKEHYAPGLQRWHCALH